MVSSLRLAAFVAGGLFMTTVAAAREPTSATLISGSIVGEDYPEAAMSGGERGTVTARYVVVPDGRVRDCTATSEVDAPTLRLWTCFLLTERFKFSPARDQNGRPVSDQKVQRVTWQLPGRAAPVVPIPVPLVPFTMTVEFDVSSDGEVSDCTTTGSAPAELRGPDVCERLRTVVPYTDASGRRVAKRVTLTTALEAYAAN